MTTIELLQNSINFIEENLKCELPVSEIAKIAGFSIYHFSRIFYDYVGMSVSAFITKRRLYYAIYDIQNGNKLVDTDLLYGFDTYAGFFKAFKREFGCSPTKFLKLNTTKKPIAVNLIKEAKIMLTKTQIRQLLSNWDIDTKLEIGPTSIVDSAIKANDVWYIGDNYILKTGKNITGLKTNIEISRALVKQGMAASYPIITNDGHDFIIEGDRFYILTNRIEGEILTSEQRYSENRIKIGKKYGVAIGKLHKVLRRYESTSELNDNNLLKTVLDWALPETKRTMEQWGCSLPEEFYEDYINTFSKLYNELPRHIIHRDANPSNIIFENGEISGFIDFEISEHNVRIFDPCYCATGILSEANNIDDSFDKWNEILRGIIDGYDSVCKITDIEKISIPYIIYSIQMIFIAWLNGKEEYKDMAIQNRKMILWIWENRNKCFGDL